MDDPCLGTDRDADNDVGAVVRGERPWVVAHGRSETVLRTLPAESIDAVVCNKDPDGVVAQPIGAQLGLFKEEDR